MSGEWWVVGGKRGEKRMVNSECTNVSQRGGQRRAGGQWLDGWLAGTDEELEVAVVEVCVGGWEVESK